MRYEVWSSYGESNSICHNVTWSYNAAVMLAERCARDGHPDVEVLVVDEHDDSIWFTGYRPHQMELPLD